MTHAAFLSAVLALLLAPGPTNTLMGLAGAQKGLRGVARLLPAELFGYLTTILPLAYLGADMLDRWPLAATTLKVAAAVWVMVLAVKLWVRNSGLSGDATVTARRVFVTTMLNPKALIFGLVLLPGPQESQFALKLSLFCLIVVAVALAWGAGGVLTQLNGGNGHRLLLVQRIASLWLAIVSATLIAGVIKA